MATLEISVVILGSLMSEFFIRVSKYMENGKTFTFAEGQYMIHHCFDHYAN